MRPPLTLFLLISSILPLFSQPEIKDIELTYIKIIKQDHTIVKGFLFDTNDDELVLLPERKFVKGVLLKGVCNNCQTVSIASIKRIKLPKPLNFKGSLVGVGIWIALFTLADKTPNPDGPNAADFANFYGLAATTIGLGIDIARAYSLRNTQKKLQPMAVIYSDRLREQSIVYQFEDIQGEQFWALHDRDLLSKRGRKIKVHTKEGEFFYGYLVDIREEHLELSSTKKKRNAGLPTNPITIPIGSIYYCEF